MHRSIIPCGFLSPLSLRRAVDVVRRGAFFEVFLEVDVEGAHVIGGKRSVSIATAPKLLSKRIQCDIAERMI